MLLVHPCATADEPRVYLDENSTEIVLGEHLMFLEDPEGALTIGDILSLSPANQWQKSNQQTLNFAYSDSVYWIRLDFVSQLDHAKEWFFEIAFPLQDYIDYYVVDGQQIIKEIHTGDRRPFDTRPYDYRNFIFDLKIPPGEQRSVYLRIASHDGLHEALPLILWDQKTFAFEKTTRDLWLGLFLGIVIVMASYNLFLYFTVRDIAYLHYVLYICFFALWSASYHGLIFQYIWPDAPDIANQALVVFLCFLSIFIIQFIRTFLDTAQYAPWMETVGRLFIVANGILLATRFIYDEYAISILVFIIQAIIAWIAAILAGIDCLRKGFRPARYFLYAWSILMTSTVVMALRAAGILESSWFTEHCVQIGCIIEVVLLSIGLGDRINELKKQAFAAQARALEVVESNLKLKNEFITAITHELRTPMNAVIGGLQLQERNSDNKLHSPLDIVESGALDMMRLVNDILSYTEMQAGKHSLNPLPTDLRKSLIPLEQRYRTITSSKGLKLIYEIDPGVPSSVIIDGDKLKTIISKLMDNACKFTNEGHVHFQLTYDGDENSQHLEVMVKDTGKGIPEAARDIIFEPFMQAEGGFSRSNEGIGIGLCICDYLVKLLNGSLRFESQPGAGTTFYVTLPCKAADDRDYHDAEPQSTAGLPVLVVEDNLVNQKVITKMLNKLNLNARVANHGQEALDLLKSESFCLILMDLQMPVMDGFQCTRRIRSQESDLRDIPIIAVSANLMDADKQQCIQTGMNDFMEKPVKLTQLQQSIERFIELPDS